MDYTTDLIERSQDDESGQQLCFEIGHHLTFLSKHGLDGFMLVLKQAYLN